MAPGNFAPEALEEVPEREDGGGGGGGGEGREAGRHAAGVQKKATEMGREMEREGEGDSSSKLDRQQSE